MVVHSERQYFATSANPHVQTSLSQLIITTNRFSGDDPNVYGYDECERLSESRDVVERHTIVFVVIAL